MIKICTRIINKMRTSVVVLVGTMLAILAGSCQGNQTIQNAWQKWSMKTQ
jgi:hypothetical protein